MVVAAVVMSCRVAVAAWRGMAVTVTWLDGGCGGYGCVMEAVVVMPHHVAVAAWCGGRSHMA